MNKLKPLTRITLALTYLFADRYTRKGAEEEVVVVEVRTKMRKYPFSEREYEDCRITYMTESGEFYTVTDKIFYMFYVKPERSVKWQ